MAVKVIVTGESLPVLRAKAAKVSSFGKEFKKLVEDLRDTVTHAKGAGLAAPQIDVSKAVCIAKIGEEFTVLANPRIFWKSDKTILGEEGCLSIPDIWLYVPRAVEIAVRYQDESGKEQERRLSDFDARVVQHEVDHLLGVLIVDYHGKGAKLPGEAL